MRSVNNVVEEIVNLKSKFPRLSTVQFSDEVFTLDNNRVIEFCKKICTLNLRIEFIASGRVKPVSEEMLLWMEKAGFKKIKFGIETGAEELMLSNRKGITKQDVKELFYKLKNVNIEITTFLIVGLPGENENTVNETIEFVNELQDIRYYCIEGLCKLWTYPGTEIYQIMKDQSCISDDYWLTDNNVPYFTAEHDYATLLKFEIKLLSHVSILKILTFQGFIHHFLCKPLIISRFLLQNRGLIKVLMIEALRTPIVCAGIRFPDFFHKLQKFRRICAIYKEKKYLKRLYG